MSRGAQLPKRIEAEARFVRDPLLLEEFWQSVERGDADSCWRWTARTATRGYGVIGRFRTHLLAHRLSLTAASGPAPEGKPYCLHSCDNTSCVNPAHLRWGSHRDNTDDAVLRGRMPGSGGRRKGSRNPRAALDDDKVRAIRRDPRTQLAIAREYGVDQTTVSAVKRLESWSHVK